MGAPVVKSTNGFGTPVTVVASGGLPVDIATNGFGTPIIEVASGGIPITYAQGGGGPPVTKLGLDARITYGGNSYSALSANIDNYQWAWMAAGLRGVPTIGMRQGRSGDTIGPHLHDRAAPLAAVRAGLVVIMNPENDLGGSGGLVGDNSANGDIVFGRLDTVANDLDAAYAGSKKLVCLSANTSSRQSKPLTEAQYRTRVGADSRFVTFDEALYFDPTDLTQSSDGIHPNTIKSARALGTALGNKIKEQFVADDIFDGGLSLPNNAITWNTATAWAATVNTSGLTAVQSTGTGTIGGRANVPYRQFAITGTSAQDPSVGTTVPDLRLRATLNLNVARSTDMVPVAFMALIEVTSSAEGDPVGLASMLLASPAGNSAFSKVVSAGDGGFLWDTKYSGHIGIMPAQLTGQVASLSFDIIVRGKTGVATDAVIRIAAVNAIFTDDVAYGPAVCGSKPFTVGRASLFTALSTTPSAGPLAVGGTLATNNPGVFVGGGLTRSFDVLRDSVTDVGDITRITQSAAAVPYTVQAGDSGHNLVVRANGSNGMGSDNVLSTALAVS